MSAEFVRITEDLIFDQMFTPLGLTDALQHRGMLSTAGLFDIIFISADHFLFYVV
jgi:hypothetical protein